MQLSFTLTSKVFNRYSEITKKHFITLLIKTILTKFMQHKLAIKNFDKVTKFNQTQYTNKKKPQY